MAREESNNPLSSQPSRKLRQIQTISAIVTYGAFFSFGIAIANISRLFPNGVAVYLALMVSAIGLAAMRAKVDAQKLIFLAIGLSMIAFWDGIFQFLNSPIYLLFWIVPLWQCLVYGFAGTIFLIGLKMAVNSTQEE